MSLNIENRILVIEYSYPNYFNLFLRVLFLSFLKQNAMRYFIAAITFIFIFSSCKDNSENNLSVYRVAEEGLQQSSKNISATTDFVYLELKEKLKASETKEKAAIWLPKAMVIKRISDE